MGFEQVLTLVCQNNPSGSSLSLQCSVVNRLHKSCTKRSGNLPYIALAYWIGVSEDKVLLYYISRAPNDLLFH